jgi:hypothetical protein
MRQHSNLAKDTAEKVVKDMRPAAPGRNRLRSQPVSRNGIQQLTAMSQGPTPRSFKSSAARFGRTVSSTFSRRFVLTEAQVSDQAPTSMVAPLVIGS